MGDVYDGFRDIREKAYGGVLNSDALKDQCSVEWMPTDDGVLLQFCCDNCGGIKQLTLEWPEVVCLKYFINPRDFARAYQGYITSPGSWIFKPHLRGWAPEMKCGDCNALDFIQLIVETHDPEKYLAAGRRAGLINPNGEKQISLMCLELAKRGLSVRR